MKMIARRHNAYLSIILFSGFLLGFTWGDGLARKNQQGNDAFDSGQYDEALNAYTEADVTSKSGDPRLPTLYNNMGNTLNKQGKYEQALAMYQKALEASQDNAFKADVHFHSGNTWFKQEDYEKALEAYNQALELNPVHLQAQQNKQMVQQLLEQQQQQQQQQNQQEDQQQQEQNQQNQKQQPEGQSQPTPTPENQEQAEQQEPQPAQEQESPEDKEQQLSEEEAMRILDALMEKEELQQQQRQIPPRPVEKDW